MNAATVFSPDANERHVHIETTECDAVHVLLHLCRGMRHTLFESEIGDRITAHATLLVLLIRKNRAPRALLDIIVA
jgi:hypothetical protein